MTHPAQGVPAPVVHLPHNVELPIIFYQGQPVITLAMMDKAHQRPARTANRNFLAHRDKLIKGEDYFHLSQAEMKSFHEFRETANPNGLLIRWSQVRALYGPPIFIRLSEKFYSLLCSAIFEITLK